MLLFFAEETFGMREDGPGLGGRMLSGTRKGVASRAQGCDMRTDECVLKEKGRGQRCWSGSFGPPCGAEPASALFVNSHLGVMWHHNGFDIHFPGD